MSDLTPEQLDEWRWEQACRTMRAENVTDEWRQRNTEYRRLVRENARPPAESDQDTQIVGGIMTDLTPELKSGGTGALTQGDFKSLFGDTIPLEAIKLVWEAQPFETVGEVRGKLIALAAKLRASQSGKR